MIGTRFVTLAEALAHEQWHERIIDADPESAVSTTAFDGLARRPAPCAAQRNALALGGGRPSGRRCQAGPRRRVGNRYGRSALAALRRHHAAARDGRSSTERRSAA